MLWSLNEDNPYWYIKKMLKGEIKDEFKKKYINSFIVSNRIDTS